MPKGGKSFKSTPRKSTVSKQPQESMAAVAVSVAANLLPTVVQYGKEWYDSKKEKDEKANEDKEKEKQEKCEEEMKQKQKQREEEWQQELERERKARQDSERKIQETLDTVMGMATANEQKFQESMNRMQEEFERERRALREEIQMIQTKLQEQVKEDTNRAIARAVAESTTWAVGGIQTGAVSSQTGSVSSYIGSASGQTGSVSNQTGAVSGQAGAVSGQTAVVSSCIGSASGQIGSVSSHTGSVSSYRGSVSGQTGSVSGQIGSVSNQTGSVGSYRGLVSGQTAAVSGQTGSLGGGQAPPSTEAAPTAGERVATREPAPAESVRQTAAPLPALCQQYWTRNGCRKEACGQVHLCKLFLAGICKFGHRCRNEHSLQSEHNKAVCIEETSRSEGQLIAELRRRFAEEGFADQKFYHSHIEICHNQAGSCRMNGCIRMHICQDYVVGACWNRESCRFSHVLRSLHNSSVLRLYKAVDMSDLALLNLLCAKVTQRGANGPQK
ncbi:golgin subfamily A member 6-like protein 2 isoform X2 [Amphibalanus amphitrite]|uniref:golgin subfamily A member 6-like protein 2 isoform X2 n=1 Tax=Amphibalanus amphitrite TaxID=1232801 RepID=UPI001C9142FA|nr:golgin subfamily A member 6-like protein 2 isoform X2 [Amphibalanus amphitrite]